jgi:hypothetical protein
MKVVNITLYEINELKGKAKENALIWIRNGNYGWSQQVEEDAKKYGITLVEWDIYRGTCKVDVKNGVETAIKIFEDYLETADIYQTAKSFMEERNKIEVYLGDDHYEQSQRFEENLRTFENALAKLYAVILRKEYDYQDSEEYCVETAQVNDWTFTEDGKFLRG